MKYRGVVGFSAIMLHCSGNKTAKQKHSYESASKHNILYAQKH